MEKTNKISRETLTGLSAQEIQNILNQALEERKAEIAGITTSDEVDKAEKELMQVMNDYDQHLNNASYELAKDVVFDGKTYKKQEIVDILVRFVSSQTVDWQNTLGLYQMVKFWEPGPDKVPYRVFDSTLRVLNMCKFTGMEDWTGILVVNEYLSQNHLEYQADLAWFLYLSAIHNTLLEQKKALSEVAQTPAQEA